MADWYVCNVDRAGISDYEDGPDTPANPTILILTDAAGAFQQTLFVNAEDAIGNQTLAVALAAVAAQRPVRGLLDMPGTVDEHDPGFCHKLEIVVNLPG